MKKKNYNSIEEWVNTLNEWEKIFWEYLNYASLGIEPNENIGEDFPNKYWVIDAQSCWDPAPCENAEGVFEAHPVIVDELLDDLDAEFEGLVLPNVLENENGKTYLRWEAGFWGTLLHRAKELKLERLAKDYEFELQVCDLVAFHASDVDLEKFI